MSQVVDEPASPLVAGRDAHARHRYEEAYALLSTTPAAGLDPDDLTLLAEAAWWTSRLDEAIAYRERAVRAFQQAGRRAEAAAVALDLAQDYVGKLKHRLAEGAMQRARRLLADEPEGKAHGKLAAVEALFAFGAGDFDQTVKLGERAQRLGKRFGEPDLEAFGLMTAGRGRISRGEVDEGLALLDEATFLAVGGELTPLSTGYAYCMAISACGELADYGRAAELTIAAETWCEQEEISGFPGICRVHRAEVKRLGGDWDAAEHEAARAAEELMNFSEDVVGAAYYEIGEVRRRRGDLDGAEEAFAVAHQYLHGAEPGMSLVHLARGRRDAALSSARRGLEEMGGHRLGRAKILPALVDIALEAGDLDTARSAVDELEEVARDYASPSPVLRANAAASRGALLLAEGSVDEALACLQDAMREWRPVGAPYEIARTRMLLATAYEAAGDAEAARLELGSARAAFVKLGAGPDANAAAERLGDTETVTRTFLFTDVVGSTEFIRQVGDDTWSGLLRTHDRTLRALFAEHGGEEVDHAGDGFFVAFTEPAPALTCAIAIQQALLAPVLRELQVRIGVHTARAEVGGASYRGQGVHTAARIAALAEGGQILASTATLQAAAMVGEEARAVSLKGIDEPVEVATLGWQ